MVRQAVGKAPARQHPRELVRGNARRSGIHSAGGRAQRDKRGGWTTRRHAEAAVLAAQLERLVEPAGE
ncbi:hypothetical protein, partial [Clavibacter michiganensis]|uniref:hypothetical protein n=1 Tax=Clavibacter michiganensis TaxID=28447 RepID=UPI00292F63FF